MYLREISLFVVLILISSCVISQDNKCNTIENETNTLVKTIIQRDNISKSQFNKNVYIHCYLKYLDESNFIVEIFLNGYNPTQADYDYKTFEIEGFPFVLVNGCLSDGELNLQKMNQFFVPDSKHWKVLVQKQGEGYRYFELRSILPR